jgi:hypothetical protein
MGEITRQSGNLPQPEQLVGALQTYLRRTPHAPEYGAISGRGYDRVVYGPFFTRFVLAQACEIRGEASDPDTVNQQGAEIHQATNSLRFDTGQIVPSLGREVLYQYAEQHAEDPHVEIARRLAVGLSEKDHESTIIARDTQIILSRFALDGGFNAIFDSPEDQAEGLQTPLSDVA